MFKRGFEGLSARELNNNDINKEVSKFLKNGISKAEAKKLVEIIRKNRNKILIISESNLTKLRKAIGSKERKNYITRIDIRKLGKIVRGERKKYKNKVKNILSGKESKESIKIDPRKLKSLERQVSKIFQRPSSFFNKLSELFQSKEDIKNGNIYRVYKILSQGGKKLKTFQKYAQLKSWYNADIDGDWGKESKKAFDKYIQQKYSIDFAGLESWLAVHRKKQYELDKIISPHTARKRPKYKPYRKGGEYEGLREVEVKNISELISKTPRGFKTLMREFFRKRAFNSGERIRNIDIKNMSAIMLMNTRKGKGLIYYNGKFRQFPIINTGSSLPGKVWKLTKVNISDNLHGDASNGGSNTLIGASFMGDGMNAQWIHGVDNRRVYNMKGSTHGCVGAPTSIFTPIAREIANLNGNLVNRRFRKGKSSKRTQWRSVGAMLNTYRLKKPAYVYVV